MKLTQFSCNRISEQLDSRPIEVGDITCLVGKNEAGKTALLRAVKKPSWDFH